MLRGGILNVAVGMPPEGGKANAAALELIAKWLRVAPSRLSLVSGKSSRNKLVFVPDELEEKYLAKLGELHGPPAE